MTPITAPSTTVSTDASSVAASTPPALSGEILATSWARYWARILDATLGCSLIAFAVGWLAPGLLDFRDSFLERTGDQLVGVILLPFAMLIEVCIYVRFGNTPGKSLAGIEVRDLAGRKLSFAQYFRRNIRIWYSGLGLGIGIVALFTLINNHRKLKTERLTSWDEAVESRVFRVRSGSGRASLAACFYIGSLAVFVGLPTKTPEQQLQEAAAAVTPRMIGDDIRLEGASAGPGRVLTYNYTVIIRSAKELDLAKVNSYLQGSMRKGMARSFCNSWGTRGLRALDATVRGRFFDKNGQLIGTIEISKRDCAGTM